MLHDGAGNNFYVCYHCALLKTNEDESLKLHSLMGMCIVGGQLGV